MGYRKRVAETAVLVVDMLNGYRHPDADRLIPNVAEIIDPLSDLINTGQSSDSVELIYVNDNYGDFTADLGDIVGLRSRRTTGLGPADRARGRQRILTKVRHSAFYSTPLAYLLGQLGTERVMLVGQVTEQCILYSALDAYVRHFEVVVPFDAVAHIDAELAAAALRMMETNMGGTLVTADDCKF